MMSESECTSTVKRCEDSKSSIRKNNKPLMEKRRRARINSCLGNLKTLVLQALKKDNAQYSKLEKADILEMTVKHLRAVQRQQMTAAMVTDPNVVTKYRTGFNECAGEVMRYLSSVQGVSDETRTRVLTHLGGCLQTVNSPPVPVMDPLRGALPPHAVSGMPVPHPAYVTSGCSPYHSAQKYFNSASHSGQDSQLFSCITGSVHLISSTLPSGQMALVLAPQVQAVPLYVAPSGQPTQAVKASPSDRSTCSSSNCESSPQTPVEPSNLRPSRSVVCPRSMSSPDCDQAVISIKEEDVWRPW